MSNKKVPTEAKAWKKINQTFDLELPSGNVCSVKRPGLEAFFRAGLIPNSLMSVMRKALSGQGIDDSTMQAEMGTVLEDPQKLQDMFDLADSIMIYCVEQPIVRSGQYTEADQVDGIILKDHKVGDDIPVAVRRDDMVYDDDVEMEDKMFIFSWAVGGTSDVEQFRTEQDKHLESLSAGQNVRKPAKSTPRPKKR